MLTYSAKDAAGNEAIALFREVRVVDPCAPEQVMCPELEMCSVLNRTCNEEMVTLFSDGDAGARAPEPYVPEPDTAPPVLKFRGVCEEPSCRPATTPSGMSVYVHTVTVGDDFTDPGELPLLSAAYLGNRRAQVARQLRIHSCSSTFLP